MRAEVERIFTIQLEVKVAERRMSDSRMRKAYERATAVAAAAVSDVLLDGSVEGVRSSMTYDYRHAEQHEEDFKPLESYSWQPELAA
jgi:hypothetical protein